MAQNPLQQYFRQPKVFVKLPSKGIFNKLGSLQGDITNMPVYSMTGMDEIIIKTPDALMSGESTVKVIQSCCPFIKDAWELSAMDLELVLAAIRIATFGNEIEVTAKCGKCDADNEYHLNLSQVIEHYTNFQYDNSVKIDGLTVRLHPLTYRESTEFSLKNYTLQKQLAQAINIEDEEHRQRELNRIFEDLSVLQTEIFNASIDEVEIATETVNDRTFIREWITNCDKDVFDALREKFESNKKLMKSPPYKAKCEHCGADNEVAFELDESNFFVSA